MSAKPINVTGYPPTIFGTANVGNTLVCNKGTWSGTWEGAPTISYAYQWQGNNVSIPDATGSSYLITASDAGRTLRCRVIATLKLLIGTSGTDTASTENTAVVTSPPVNTLLPSLSGTVAIGSTLLADKGNWSGTTPLTPTYQWWRGSTPISGETSTQYLISVVDSSKTLRCVVKVTNSVGSLSLTTASTVVVTSPPVNTTLPSISGAIAIDGVISVSTGTWTGWPIPTFTYEWKDSLGAVIGATSAYAIKSTNSGHYFYCKVTASNGTSSFATTANTIPVPPIAVRATSAPGYVASNPPTISGVAIEGSVLCVSAGGWTGYPAPTFTYQWASNGADITGAVGSTYTIKSTDISHGIRCTVTALNSSGSSAVTSTPTLSVVAATSTLLAPASSTNPVISGTSAVGSPLSVERGVWAGNPTPTFAYQWLRNSVEIQGEGAQIYRPTAADSNNSISCKVVATGYGAPVTKLSNSISILPVVVVPIAPTYSSSPTLSAGPYTLGSVISVSPGVWQGTPTPAISYSWTNANSVVLGTAASYKITLNELAQRLSCKVTATSGASSAYFTVTASSLVALAPTPSDAPPACSKSPTITGYAVVGAILSVSNGAWSGYPAPNLYYQWRREMGDIPNQTKSTYLVSSADYGKTLSCLVTGKNTSNMAGLSKISDNSSSVTAAPLNTTIPTITQSGATLTLTNEAAYWSNSPASFAYLWVCGNSAVPNSNSKAYTVVNTQQGLPFACVVTATNNSGSASVVVTFNTVVLAPPVADTSKPPIIKTSNPNYDAADPKWCVGDTLTTSTGTWTGSQVTYTYQWKANGSAISGETKSTHVVTPNDYANGGLSVTVGASNPGNTGGTASSGATVSIVYVPVNSVPPTLSKTVNVKRGDTITCDHKTWSGVPLTYTYQWKRAGFDITSATAADYTVVTEDVGSTLSCGVKAKRGSETSSEVCSESTKAIYAAPWVITAPALSDTNLGNPTLRRVLTASPGVWGGLPLPKLDYQWFRKYGTEASTPVSSSLSYIPVYGDGAGTTGGACTYSFKVTATNTIGETLNATVKATGATGALQFAPVNSGAPQITSTDKGKVGAVLSANISGSWSESPTAISATRTWYSVAPGASPAILQTYEYIFPISPTPLTPADTAGLSLTLTTAHIGKTIYCELTRKNGIGTPSIYTAYFNSPITAVTSCSELPVVSGMTDFGGTEYPVVGSVLTCSSGKWNNISPLSYKWAYSSDKITWADAAISTARIRVIFGYANMYLRCTVTTEDGSTANSNITKLCYAGPEAIGAKPTITAIPATTYAIGGTITASANNITWNAFPFSAVTKEFVRDDGKVFPLTPTLTHTVTAEDSKFSFYYREWCKNIVGYSEIRSLDSAKVA